MTMWKYPITRYSLKNAMSNLDVSIEGGNSVGGSIAYQLQKILNGRLSDGYGVVLAVTLVTVVKLGTGGFCGLVFSCTLAGLHSWQYGSCRRVKRLFVQGLAHCNAIPSCCNQLEIPTVALAPLLLTAVAFWPPGTTTMLPQRREQVGYQFCHEEQDE